MLIPWTRATRVQGVESAKYISMFCFINHAAARLHLFLAAACNSACDWQACGCWPMSSLETNVLLLFLHDAGEYNF